VQPLSILQSSCDYSSERFLDLKLDQSELESVNFADCSFARCDFSGTRFINCRFIDCHFEDCDLSLARLPNSVFSTVTFHGSRLLGIDWTEANWTASRLGKPLSFDNCNLSHSTFIGLSLPGLRLAACQARDVDFRESDLSRAELSDTDFIESIFLATNLSGANLSSARNYAITPEENKLAGTRFSLPEAISLLHNMNIRLDEGV